MAQINPPLVLVLLMCLARVVLSAPPETEQDATDATSPLSELVTVQYTEAVGTGDFTLGNTSSTFEEILAEVGLTDYDTRYDVLTIEEYCHYARSLHTEKREGHVLVQQQLEPMEEGRVLHLLMFQPIHVMFT